MSVRRRGSSQPKSVASSRPRNLVRHAFQCNRSRFLGFQGINFFTQLSSHLFCPTKTTTTQDEDEDDVVEVIRRCCWINKNNSNGLSDDHQMHLRPRQLIDRSIFDKSLKSISAVQIKIALFSGFSPSTIIPPFLPFILHLINGLPWALGGLFVTVSVTNSLPGWSPSWELSANL